MSEPIEGAGAKKKEMEDDDNKFDKEEVESAKEVIQSLAKTARTLKIYLSNNPIHKKFIDELLEKLQAHLLTYGTLRLRVKQFELYCSGQVVYENINRMESIAFKLFIDGMREISFLSGIEREEIVTFMEVLGRGSDEKEADDDIVTLLWEEHLSHIKYVVVESLQTDLSDIESCKEMQTNFPSQQKLESVYTQEGGLSSEDLAPAAQRKVGIPSLHIFKLTKDEIDKIKGEVQGEEGIDIVGELLGILFDILRIERQIPIVSEILDILDNILHRLMVKGDFNHARKILEFFWEMLDSSKNLPEALHAEIQNALLRAGNPKRIASLEPVLNGSGPDLYKEFFPFMILFEKNVVPPMVELLSTVKKMKARRVLCDVLAEIGRMNVESLIAKLDGEHWYIVRNLIYVLGKIGGDRVIESFHPFVQHEEPKVRKEVLHALDVMEDQQAMRLMTRFIGDPDQTNRLFAVRSLARKEIKEGLPPLMEEISSKRFDAKELYEKKEWFDAIAKIGGDEVVPQIRNCLKVRWRLFKNVRIEEKGLCVAGALRRIGSPLAIEALHDGCTSKNKVIREACHKALTALEANQT